MKPVRVLIIDDDERLLRIVARVCAKLGAAPLLASSAAAGRALIEHGDFDAVICDSQLDGGASGLALLERAHELAPGSTLVITSGDLPAAVPAHLVRLEKPYGLPELRQVIALALDARDAATLGARG